MAGDLDGKLAFVTGAGSGIGRAICLFLEKEGATVIACDKNSKAVGETLAALDGSEHIAFTVDVTSSKHINDALLMSLQRYRKPPTLIVNCAGILEDKNVLEFTDDNFHQVKNTNLKGTCLVTEKAVQMMISQGASQGGSIVNIGSIMATIGNPGQSNYTTLKEEIQAFTKSASVELGVAGIRVNMVLPGLIETPLIEAIPEPEMQILMSRTSLRRIGKPEEIGKVVTFLCSDRSSFITGTSIEVTGGYH